MAFTELELARYTKAFAAFRKKYGPKPEIRSKLDWGCRIEGQSVELYEIRPRWDDPTQIMHSSFAKATFVKSTALWKIYWMRASGKWNSYPTCPEVGTLEKFFQVVKEDVDCCFFG
ncbi:MAG: hypothetical protein DESF_01312 [Desulfovibrio sp.]